MKYAALECSVTFSEVLVCFVGLALKEMTSRATCFVPTLLTHWSEQQRTLKLVLAHSADMRLARCPTGRHGMPSMATVRMSSCLGVHHLGEVAAAES